MSVQVSKSLLKYLTLDVDSVFQVGCEDGTVRLFDITDDGLSYRKSLDQQQGTTTTLIIWIIYNTQFYPTKPIKMPKLLLFLLLKIIYKMQNNRDLSWFTKSIGSFSILFLPIWQEMSMNFLLHMTTMWSVTSHIIAKSQKSAGAVCICCTRILSLILFVVPMTSLWRGLLYQGSTIPEVIPLICIL